MKRLIATILLVVILLAMAVPMSVSAATIFNIGPGDSIQDAIDAASYGDTINVAAGIYNESITLKDGVKIIGAGAIDTRIDGGGTLRVVTAVDVGSDTELEGFTIANGYSHSYSGGMYNGNSSPTVTDCVFTGNTANNLGGGMCNWNGSSPTLINCTFIGNTSSAGGGIYTGFSSSTLINCTFIGNTSTGYGGGVYNQTSPSTVINSTFSGNTAAGYGGGIYNNFSVVTVTNCTFTGNTAGASGGGMHNAYRPTTAANCIFWDNGDEIFSLSTVTVASYCDVQGGYPGTGNIDADPMFVNPAIDDYHLQPGSPCIDTGNDSAPLLPATDFEGDPRIGGAKVDMGADEYYVSGFNVTVNAEADSNPLAVTIDWSYDGSAGTDNTSYTIDDIPDGYSVTLTAPFIHLEGSNVYAFQNWDVGVPPSDIDWNTTSFTVGADTTATAYYLELENYITGGGNIKSVIEKGRRTVEQVAYTFGGNVGISDTLGIVGNFQIGDHTEKKVEAWYCTTGEFTYLAFGDVDPDLSGSDPGAETPEASNDMAAFIGDFSSNRGNDATLAIMIWDNQEPGKDFDTIWVMKWNESTEVWEDWIGSFTLQETISGGNFQLHDYE